MKNLIKVLVLAAAAVFMFTACQDLFTTSLFSFVEADMSVMSPEQKVSYAEDLLLSGSPEELAAAYAEIAKLLPDDYMTADDLTDEELELVILAADLAIGASGVGDAVTGAIALFTGGDDPVVLEEGINDLIGDIDLSSLENSVGMIEAAENNDAELSTQQYSNAAAAQLLVVLHDVEGLGIASPSELDPDNEDHDEIIADLEQALDWADAGGFDPSILGDGIAMPTP